MKTLDIRLVVVLMAVLATFGCARGTSKQSAPATQAGNAAMPSTDQSVAHQVALEYAGEEWDAYGNFLTVLKLTNRSQHDISYPGYSTASPLYMEQVRGSDSAGWRDRRGGWCGVGLGTQQLRGGQSATFSLLPPTNTQSWRIGIEIEHLKAHVLWSEPIAADAQIVQEAPSADKLVQATVVKHPTRDFPYAFALKNVSGTPLYYGGYQEQHGPPIYLNQEKRPEGWYDDGKADWSGTGFGFKELPPGRSISFSIPAQSLDSTWRIGIRLFKTARPVSHNDAYSPVWWESLPPRSKA